MLIFQSVLVYTQRILARLGRFLFVSRWNFLMRSFFRTTAGAAFLLTIGAGFAFAAEPVQQHNSNALWFENWNGLSNATLKIVAPNGKVTELFTSSGTPVFQLVAAEVLDGIYSYELSAATSERETIVNPVNNGRGESQEESAAQGLHLNGVFTVSRGVIITPEDVTEGDG